MSGAEFQKRPGFLRLMNALRPRAPFQILIMAEESRLGRESIEVAYALKQFSQASVRVFLYLEDRERTIDSPTEKLLMSVAAFADEMERERARQRTADGRPADLGRIVRVGDVAVAVGLGEPVHVADLAHAEIHHHLHRRRRADGGAGAERREIAPRAVRMLGEGEIGRAHV